MPHDHQPADSYDVAILVGGLAGLTLGHQLKQARPETSIFIAEKHEFPVREAAFKVGESTQEISCHYFGDVLGFKEHLENEQIHKNGLRFWFTAGDNSELAERVERGPAGRLPVPTYQLDRGRFENSSSSRRGRGGSTSSAAPASRTSRSPATATRSRARTSSRAATRRRCRRATCTGSPSRSAARP